MYIVLIYLAVAAFGWFNIFWPDKNNNKLTKILFFSIMLFFMLRFGLGSDTRSYIYFYQHLPNNIPDAVADHTYRFPLYNLLMLAIRSCGGSYAVFFGLVNILVASCVSYTIYKESSDWMISLIIFLGSGILMTYYSSAIRQMICMAVFFLAFYRFLLKNRYWAYYLTVVPLVFIHEISVITLIIPLFYSARRFFLTKKGILIFSITMIALFLVVSIGIPIFASYLPVSWRELVFYNNTGEISVLGLGLRTILFCMVLVLYYFANDSVKHNPRVQFEIFICYFSFLFYMLFMRNPLVSRVSDYLEIIHLVLVPELFCALSSISKKKTVYIGIAALYCLLLILDLKDNVSSWYYDQNLLHYPYVSIFNAQDIARYYSLKQ